MKSGRLVNQLSGYQAFIPESLPPQLEIKNLQAALEEASLKLGQLEAVTRVFPKLDPIIAMYTRKEALLSSQIEGTQASLDDLFSYESSEQIANMDDVEEVVNYLRALNHGLDRLREFPMSIRLIKEMHAILMQGVRGERSTPGEFRRSQNWIGPPGSTLVSASFVPPPPQEMVEAMSSFERFLHSKSDLPPLIICALIHYQFETIHPFLDGNGRLGRLLITHYLHWRKLISAPVLYMSYYLKLHCQEYYDRLDQVRQRGDYEQWIRFFLEGVSWTAQSALETLHRILQLQDRHTEELTRAKVSSPLAMSLLTSLVAHPFLSISEVATQFSISYQAAKKLVGRFITLGLLKELPGRKRDKKFVYWEYLDLLAEGSQP